MSPLQPIRLVNKLTVTQLAQLTNFNKSYISRVKNGKKPPSKKLLEMLSNHQKRDTARIDYLPLFLQSRQAHDVSEGTTKFYEIKLGRFLSQVDSDKANLQSIERFLLQFDNVGNRHAYYRALKTFYIWRV